MQNALGDLQADVFDLMRQNHSACEVLIQLHFISVSGHHCSWWDGLAYIHGAVVDLERHLSRQLNHVTCMSVLDEDHVADAQPCVWYL